MSPFWWRAGLLASGLLLSAEAGWSSGPFGSRVDFWQRESPGVSVDQLLAGELGILDLGQDRARLLVAYRHLAGIGVDGPTAAALRAAFWPPPKAESQVADWRLSDPYSVWRSTRERLSGLPPAPSHSWRNYRGLDLLDAAGNRMSWWTQGCLDDAFRTAAGTLEARAATYGVGSPEVRVWTEGQDVVFERCGEGDEPPPELDDSYPALLRQDRIYQRAAALFYALRYSDAYAAFTAIAADSTSPWATTSHLVAARTLIRWAQLREVATGHVAAGGDGAVDHLTDVTGGSAPGARELWLRADRLLAELLADRGASSLQASARRLRNFVADRLEPARREVELGGLLIGRAGGVDSAVRSAGQQKVDSATTLDQALDGLLWLAAGRPELIGPPAPDPSPPAPELELADWLVAMRQPHGGNLERWRVARPAYWDDQRHLESGADPPAVGRWVSRQTLPWLVAALVALRGDEPAAGLVAEAAVKALADAGNESPAAATLAYHAARLFAWQGRDEEARALLEPWLARWAGGPRREAGRYNRVALLLADLATNLDSYLALSLQRPVAVGKTDGNEVWEWEGDGFEAFRREDSRLLSAEATAVLSLLTPDGELARLAALPAALDREQRRRVAGALLTRQLIAVDVASLASFRPVVDDLLPEVKTAAGKLLDRLIGLGGDPSSQAESRFLTALVLLRLPGLQPGVAPGVGRLTPLGELAGRRDNGWCDGGGLAHEQWELPLPLPAAPGIPLRPRPRFVTSDAVAAAKSAGRFADLAASPVHLGRWVLDWVAVEPGEALAPEALHRVVRATRYGCHPSPMGPAAMTLGDVSRRAFELLHDRYPRSSWTAKTPYWFD